MGDKSPKSKQKNNDQKQGKQAAKDKKRLSKQQPAGGILKKK